MALPDLVTVIARNSAIRARTIQEAEAYIRSRLWALEELAVNELYAIYREAFERMASRLRSVAAQYGAGETWSASDLAFRTRTEAVLAQIGSELESLNSAAMDAALRASVRGYQAGYYGGAWQLEEGLRTGLPLEIPILPTDAIRAAILEPYIGLTFVDRFLDARGEFERIVRRAMVESQIEGESIYQAQVRLARALGVDISRRTAAARAANQAYFYRTELIARTEILRASNNGALAIYERNQDVLRGWQWTATKDERTCPICGALDGQIFRFGSQHLPPPTGSHPRCRCTPTPVLINSALEERIVGARQTYREWAAARGITIAQDGGVLYFRSTPPPKSPSAGAAKTAPHLYPRGA